MRKFLLLACAAALSLSPNLSLAQTPGNLKIQSQQGVGIPNNSTGYEFYVAIPPNESETYGVNPFVEIYLASGEATSVDLYFAGTKLETIDLLPNIVKVVKLDYKKCEIRKSETPLNQTYRFVSSSAPISVYTMNGKESTTDGMMVLPVTAWGTEYIHNSYWENGEAKNDYFKSGFVVIASEDNSHVSISLKSAKGSVSGKSDKGRTPGEVWTVGLNKGQCYKVCTDAATLGAFDISGTKITSDKPIGMISFHERAVIPQQIKSSRNHLVEMIPPTTAWGYKYASVEFDRSGGGGDLFRIICKEPQTEWFVNWYDKTGGVQLGSENGTLAESGDFVELKSNPTGRPSPDFKSIRGTSVFKANKPIQVFQYAFSAAWDSTIKYDPFYITCTPVDQFSKETIFQVPSNKDFIQNSFNIFVVGDTLDAQHNDYLLSSVCLYNLKGNTCDSMYVANTYPNLKSQRIPGTNLYWCTISLTGGAYRIKGDTKFGGYIYGFSDVDGYGWPAVSMDYFIGREDYISPTVKIDGKNGEYKVNLEDAKVEAKIDYTQYDYGIVQKPELTKNSSNFQIEFENGSWIPAVVKHNVGFNLAVLDKKKDAKAELFVKDRAGNSSIATFNYTAPVLKVESAENINFGKVNNKSTISKWFFLRNEGSEAIQISKVYLQKNSNFKITFGSGDYDASMGYLGVNSPLKLEIEYMPEPGESKDVITVIANGVEFKFDVLGYMALNKVNVSDFTAGQVIIGESKKSSKSIIIENTGTETLAINSIKLIDSTGQFAISDFFKNMDYPLSLNVKGKMELTNIATFKPTKEGAFTAQIIVACNGAEGDSIAVLTGVGVKQTDVNDIKKIESNMTISPNPCMDGNFSVELANINANESANIEIIDESGVIVKTIIGLAINSSRLNVEASELPSGNYFVKVKVNGFEYTSKFKIAK